MGFVLLILKTFFYTLFLYHFSSIICLFLLYIYIALLFLSPGLEIGKFYFCKKEELTNTLQSNKVNLFVSTDRDAVYNALHTGKHLTHYFQSYCGI